MTCGLSHVVEDCCNSELSIFFIVKIQPNSILEIMKQGLFMLVFTLLGMSAFSQVVLTSAQSPVAGQKLLFDKVSNPSSLQFARSGANLLWDFSQVVSEFSDTVKYVSPESTGFSGAFPSATVAMAQTDGFGMISVTDQVANLLGAIGDPGTGVQPLPLSPPLPLFTFPYTFGSAIDATSKLVVKMSGVEYGMPTADSVKYVMTLHTIRNVQGWGKLKLKNQDFDGALLEKTVMTQTDEAFMKVFLLGWVTVPGFPTVSTDTTYRWFSGLIAHPYVEITMNEGGIADSARIWVGDYNVGLSKINANSQTNSYPNPSSSFVTISNPLLTSSSYRVSIYDVAGVEVFTAMLNTDKAGSIVIPISTLSGGCYIVRLNSPNLELSTKIVKQ